MNEWAGPIMFVIAMVCLFTLAFFLHRADPHRFDSREPAQVVMAEAFKQMVIVVKPMIEAWTAAMKEIERACNEIGSSFTEFAKAFESKKLS